MPRRIVKAIGTDTEAVQVATDEASEEADSSPPCGIIRRHLPWDTVIEPIAINRQRTNA